MWYENYSLNEIVTPIIVPELKRLLSESGYDQLKSEELVNGFNQGFDIGYRGPMKRNNLANNLPIRGVGSLTEMWNKVMEEVKLHRYSGPFKDILFKHYVQSPIGLVPKAGGKTRLIFHLSYDFGSPEDVGNKSINFHTPVEFCTVHYRDLDYVVRTCLALKLVKFNQLKRFFTENAEPHAMQTSQEDLEDGLYFSKTDLKSAFRLLPVLVSQQFLLILKAVHPVTKETYYYVENNLPFGASSSCSKFQAFSDALCHIFESITGRTFCCTNYLDDYLFIQMSRQACNNMVSQFLGGLSLHLNHLIAERVSTPYRQFGTLPIGICLSNLDSGQLETSLMTSYCHF